MPLVCSESLKIGLNGISARQKYDANRQGPKFLGREPAMARDVVEHFFRRLPRKPSHRGRDDGTKRQNVLMDGQQIDDVAGFAPVRSGCRFVCGEIHGMKHITEKLILLGREEPKGAVGHPLKLNGLAETFHLRLTPTALNLPS